jgi:transcriptional regulator GlxA family with amidase domain
MRLKDIQNWRERAQAAKWSAATLAQNRGVSVRTLHRHFKKEMGNPVRPPRRGIC